MEQEDFVNLSERASTQGLTESGALTQVWNMLLISRDIALISHTPPHDSNFAVWKKVSVFGRLFSIGKFDILDELCVRAGWARSIERKWLDFYYPRISAYEQSIDPQSQVTIMGIIRRGFYRSVEGLNVDLYEVLGAIRTKTLHRSNILIEVFLVPTENYKGDFWVVRSGLWPFFASRYSDLRPLIEQANSARFRCMRAVDLSGIWKMHIKGKLIR